MDSSWVNTSLDLNINPFKHVNEITQVQKIKKFEGYSTWVEQKLQVKNEDGVRVLVEELTRISSENKKLTEMLGVVCDNYMGLQKHLADLVSKNSVKELGTPISSRKRKAESEDYSIVINGISGEGFRQGGQFEEAIKAYVEMEKSRLVPDERTLEAVLSVYCIAGLVDESVEQFQEIKALGILPNVMCYCMMLAVYAKSDRWNEAYELLDEMLTNRASNIHQVIGQMIKGDFDDDSNWQMVEYVFDKLNSEGCGLGMRFYNTLLEALWWLGQKERAVRVLGEATKRGHFPELFRKSKLVWSVDIHRMWEGSAYTAISVWLNNMYEMFMNREDIPQVASVIVVRGLLEKSSVAQDFPIGKAVHSFLQDIVPSSFSYSGWNKGRITCQRSQLKRFLLGTESVSDGTKKDKFMMLTNSPLSLSGTRTSSDIESSQHNKSNSGARMGTRTELMTSTV